ncbi:hypothetical protein D9M70_653270 [compost metagenome]
MQQHVRILVLRRFRPIALRVGVCGNVEGIFLQHPADVCLDILGELRIDLIEHVLPVEERPHFTDGLVADPGDDAAHLV